MADMDVQIVTNVEGLEELEEAFKDGSKRAIVKFLRRVEMKVAKLLVDSAKQCAPYFTGRLESDIHRQSVVGDGTLTVRVGPGRETFYGQFQEFGAPAANVPALHWLENSARAVEGAVLETFQQELTDALGEMKKV